MTINAAEVAAIKARVSLLDVIGRHVVLQKKGNEHVGLCPFHEEKSPSFKVRPDKGFFKCFGCGAYGDVFEAAMKLGRLDFSQAFQRLRDDASITRALTPEEMADLDRQRRERDEREAAELAVKVAQASAIWKSAVPISATPAETYLHSRGIDPLRLLANSWPPTLRYAANAMDPGKKPLAALLMAVGSRAGTFKGVQRVFLRPDGRAVLKADGDKLKLSLGDIRCHSAKFSAVPHPQGRWGIAEGGENALAAQQLFQIPVEAGISSGNMQNVVPPDWARHVTIFADHDGAGFIAAQACRQRYLAIPTIETVCVLAANKPGADAADLLTQGITAHAA
jgi:DNA primase